MNRRGEQGDFLGRRHQPQVLSKFCGESGLVASRSRSRSIERAAPMTYVSYTGCERFCHLLEEAPKPELRPVSGPPTRLGMLYLVERGVPESLERHVLCWAKVLFGGKLWIWL